MTVTAGDTIVVGCVTNNDSFDPSNLIASDNVNGYYDAVQGNPHPANAHDWMTVFVFQNSAGGSITPKCSNWEVNGMVIIALAFKSTRTTQVLDGASAINLFNSVGVAATNPNAGTAGAPTNANEAVVCMLDLTSSTATTAGAGYSPTGTLTGVINTLAQYYEYQINPGAVNCNFGTGVAKTYTDTQIALLNASNPSGYKALTGFYGAPSGSQTNNATVTAAILNTQTPPHEGSLFPLAPPSGGSWTLGAGSNVTFDTSVAPLGSLNLLVNGVAHTLGDAGTSIKVPSANTTTAYDWTTEGFQSNGTGVWLGSFMRVGTNATNATGCDTYNMDATLGEGNWTTQVFYTTVNGIYFQIERDQGNTAGAFNLFPSTTLNRGQDYYVISHAPGVNEANDEIFVFGEATPGVLPWVLIDHITHPKSGKLIATTTATAGSGASTITVASATGIVIGQSVFSATTSTDTGQITHGATVTSVSGTSIGISIPTTASMSATPVEFAGPTASTTASVTAGSTTLTVVSGTGIVAGASGTGQFIGMAGVQAGTWVASGSGTTWTMSQPATTTQTSVAAQFWAPVGSTYGVHFGKYSSCTSPADMWFSGFIFDPYGTLLPLIANGTLQL